MKNKKHTIVMAIAVVMAVIFLIFIWMPNGEENSTEDDSFATMETKAALSETEKNASSNEKQIPSSEISEEKYDDSSLFQIGDSAITDQFEFIVTNSYVLDYLGEYKKIPEGAIYVVVEYEYKNISKQPISSWDLPTVQLMDGTGAVYSQDSDASWYLDSYSDSKLISDLNPGIKTKDAKIFEVAIDVLNEGGMRAYVQADKKFFVALPLSYQNIAGNVYEDGYLGNAKADSWYEEIGDAGDEYILEDSANRYLTKEELMYLSKEDLRLARNEIYARRGRLFNSSDLQDYFNSMSWYYGTIPADQFDESVLNEYEKANLITIKEVEMMK